MRAAARLTVDRQAGLDRALRPGRRVGAGGSAAQGRGADADRRAFPGCRDRQQHLLALDRRDRRGLRRARAHGRHPLLEPPLLMPLVEVIAGAHSRPEAIELAHAAVASCGKRPVLVQRDVPGFIWNRLQHALLREALWIVDHGVATPEAVDEVVRFGNARRWEHVGPFAAAALGGIDTWQRVAGELFPVLSNADDAGDLHARCGPARRSSRRSPRPATPSSRATSAAPDGPPHFPSPRRACAAPAACAARARAPRPRPGAASAARARCGRPRGRRSAASARRRRR